MRIEFTRAGIDGVVEVEIGVNDEPAELGCPDYARGFPYCRATVSPPARGYNDLLGWVQLVDSDHREPGFEIDPFTPIGPVEHPFGFYGFAPTLFDAPHSNHGDWEFLAHTFLCGLGEDALSHRGEIDAVLGFSWGFRLHDGSVAIEEPAPLSARDWDRHRDYLRKAFPKWLFQPGFSGTGSGR